MWDGTIDYFNIGILDNEIRKRPPWQRSDVQLPHYLIAILRAITHGLKGGSSVKPDEQSVLWATPGNTRERVYEYIRMLRALIAEGGHESVVVRELKASMVSPQASVKVEGNFVAEFVLTHHHVGALEVEEGDDEDSQDEAWSLSEATSSLYISINDDTRINPVFAYCHVMVAVQGVSKKIAEEYDEG